MRRQGFTIVELLIVIVGIAILAAISIVAYNGIQDRAKNAQVQNDIRNVSKLIELYKAENSQYPSTGSLSAVYEDSNCTYPVDSDGYKGQNWVPSISVSLPQNPGLSGTGRTGAGGCYLYASDGVNYIVSAWNAKRGGAATDAMYKRFGWRETPFWNSDNYYICNHVNVGGGNSPYNAIYDYYKHSYTISNITSCNEAPPSGA